MDVVQIIHKYVQVGVIRAMNSETSLKPHMRPVALSFSHTATVATFLPGFWTHQLRLRQATASKQELPQLLPTCSPYQDQERLSPGHLSRPPARAMDSPIVTQLFRQLFRHRACPSRRNLLKLATTIQDARQSTQRRGMATRRDRGATTPARNESHWQQRTDIFPADMTDEFKKYPMVTAKELRSYKERPRRVKMLMRDFIEGAFASLRIPGPIQSDLTMFCP